MIVVAAAIVYLVGNASVVLWDRDEPRYAQTSRQMLSSGDWIVPRLLDEPREKKPVFIYWCQATSMAVFGPTAFAARLPSVIFVTATLIVLATLLWRSVGPERAMWTTFIFATSALTVAAAKMCITDGVLILFVTIAQMCLFVILRGRGTWPVVIACGLAIGFGMLTKGPVVPAVMGMTLLVLMGLKLFRNDSPHPSPPPEYQGRGSIVKIMVIIVLAMAVLAPWLLAIEHRLPGYTLRTLQAEVLERAAKPQEGHSGPPGYYLLTIWGTFLPWSILLPAALIGAWRNRSVPEIRFALAAVIGPWLMFEIVQTKLVHYLLPVFPALAYLTAEVIVRSKNLRRLAAWLGIAMLILVTIGYGVVIPRIPELRMSKRLAEILVREGATHPGDAIMIDYKETSLPFYQGGTIRPIGDNDFLIHTEPEKWPQWIVITDAIWKRMPDEVRSKLALVGTVHGWNYAGDDADGNHAMDVHVLSKKQGTLSPP